MDAQVAVAANGGASDGSDKICMNSSATHTQEPGQRRALITGITGQDGSFLAEFLIHRGYQVHGIVRRASTFNTERLDGIYADPHNQGVRLSLHYGDITDGAGLRRILEQTAPDEIYNLAAQSHVRVSFDQAEYTADAVATGTLRLLEAVRDYISSGRKLRMYQAGSSEMFGAAPPPQNENTPFYPRSPYAVSKVAAHWYAVNYREAYGLHLSNGLLFNHESPRRGETFVTRKITRALTRIKLGLQENLYLGNLEARRDWGFAGDYVEAMWLMLQQPEPDDYVIATGRNATVRDMCEIAFRHVGLDYRDYVVIDPALFRPAEVDLLLGNPAKAKARLGWQATTDLETLIRMMVDADMERVAKG